MIFWLLLLVLGIPQAGAHGDQSALELKCAAALATSARSAKEKNTTVVQQYIRSSKYASPSEHPESFWIQSYKNPKDFYLKVADNFELLGNMAVRYETLLKKIQTRPITEETAQLIAQTEADPAFNQLLDEYEAMSEFEKYTNGYGKKTLEAYNTVAPDYRSLVKNVISLRGQLKEELKPGKLKTEEATLLLNAWIKTGHTSDFHPDMLPDWIIGADAAQNEAKMYLDPVSGHQIGYGTTPLGVVSQALAQVPITKGDTVMDVGSGWGRVVIAGALTHPQYNFSGVEYVGYRAEHAQNQIQTLGIQNAKSFAGDASAKDFEKNIEQSKVMFLFNSFAEPALELFLERSKDVVKRTGEVKYIVAINEAGFPFSLARKGLKIFARGPVSNGHYSQYTIYEIRP